MTNSSAKRFLISLGLCLWAGSAGSLFAYDAVVDGVYYNLSATDGTAEVTHDGGSYYNCYSGEVTVPASVTVDGTAYAVTSIGNRAFYNCEDLTAVSLPDGLRTVGVDAFSNCRSLTLLTVPASVESISENSFFYCTGLLAVYLLGETSLGGSAFSYCTALLDFYCWAVTPPNAIISAFMRSNSANATLHVPAESIDKYRSAWGWNQFGTVVALTEDVTPPAPQEPVLGVCIDGLYYNLYPGAEPTAEVIRGEEPYSGEVVIPAEVSYGGEVYAVTAIGMSAFFQCADLTAVVMPSGLREIGLQAFHECTGLATADLPASVTDIGPRAFYGCLALSQVHLPEALVAIGDYAFAGCSGLTELSFAAQCAATVGDAAFWGCTGLTSVVVPEGVTEIGAWAFLACRGLQQVRLESGATLGSQAFGSCIQLSEFYCTAAQLVTAAADAFSGSGAPQATLYVPEALVSTYRTTAPWSAFGTIAVWDDSTTGLAEAAFRRPMTLARRGDALWIHSEDRTVAVRVHTPDGRLVAVSTAAPGQPACVPLPAGATALLVSAGGETRKVVL